MTKRAIINSLPFISTYDLLFESATIADIQKTFKLMPADDINKWLELDPTYEGGNIVGKYTNWLFTKWIYPIYKNKKTKEDYQNLLKQYPDGINPRNGQPFNKPTLLPEMKREDILKFKQDLAEYDKYKKIINKKITEFNSEQELYDAVQQAKIKAGEIKLNDKIQLMLDAEKDGLEIIYGNTNDNNGWLIGVPRTYESSSHFKKPTTNWCTGYPDMYNYYKTKCGGQYYILLKKDTGDLFQFHFESLQFMDVTDHRIDMKKFTETYPDICHFLFDYQCKAFPPHENNGKSHIVRICEAVDKIFEGSSTNSFTDTLEDVYEISIKDDMLYGTYSFSSIPSELFTDLKQDWIADFLEIPYSKLNFDYYVYKLSYYGYYSYIWDEIAKKNGLNITYNDLIKLNNKIKEGNELHTILYEDFYNDVGVANTLGDAREYGTINEVIKDIKDGLKDALPIEEFISDDRYKIKLSKKEFWAIYYIKEIGEDGYDDWWKIYDNYEKGVYNQKELPLMQNVEFNDDWYKLWDNHDEDDPWYYSNSYEYNWLTIYIQCFTNEEGITITEPQYGWDGFDENYWKEACEYGIPMIKEIVGDLTFDEIYDKYCKLTEKEQEDEEYIDECLRHGFKALNVKHFY